MDNVFRPSTAFGPAAPESFSALHDLVTAGITKEIEKLCAATWAQYGASVGTPEEQEAFRKAYREKVDRLYPPRYQAVQQFEMPVIRTGA